MEAAAIAPPQSRPVPVGETGTLSVAVTDARVDGRREGEARSLDVSLRLGQAPALWGNTMSSVCWRASGRCCAAARTGRPLTDRCGAASVRDHSSISDNISSAPFMMSNRWSPWLYPAAAQAGASRRDFRFSATRKASSSA